MFSFYIIKTPSTLFCTKRKLTKPLPAISNQFSYSEEDVTSDQITYLTDIHYAYKLNLIRYEAKNTRSSAISFYSKDPIVFIADYSIGVQYGINKVLGNCSIRGIRSDDFGEDSEFTQSFNESGLGLAIRMKSPQSFLSLDSDYVHTAKRKMNGIRSDIYISNRSSLGINYFYEYAFSQVSTCYWRR